MPVAKVLVYLKKGILDPQGKAVRHILGNMGFKEVQEVRVGKYITLRFDDRLDGAEVRRKTEEICQKLLANPVIEDYSFEIEE